MTHPLRTNLSRLALAGRAFLAQHPRGLPAAFAAFLLGSAAAAFGVAPFVSDSTPLPDVSHVTQALSLQPLVAPGTLSAESLTLFRSDVLRRDDTAQSMLRRVGVSDASALAFLRTDLHAKRLFAHTRSPKIVSVQANERGQLLGLVARWLPDEGGRQFERLVIDTKDGRLSARLEQGQISVLTQLASAQIESSLFAATDAANLPDSVAAQLAEIFGADIDFRRDLQRGDRFGVVYELLQADGETLGAGRILSAEFTNRGRTHEAVWFGTDAKSGAYYSFDGQTSRKSYLASPLAFSRVSSGYGMRFHPISGTQQAHLGVDYAAVMGTPVRAVGDGVVSFAGWQRGYGNVVQIAHKDKQGTVYAHLSRIEVKSGQRIEQGSLVGAVGSTGSSTGPHLHFEFRQNGVPQDPLSIARQSQNVALSAPLRTRFNAVALGQRQLLSAAATQQQASAQ